MAVKRRTFRSLWLPISLILFSIFSLFLFLTFKLGIASGAQKERNQMKEKRVTRYVHKIVTPEAKSKKDASTQYESQGPSLPPPPKPNYYQNFDFNGFGDKAGYPMNQQQNQLYNSQPFQPYQPPPPKFQSQYQQAQAQVFYTPPPPPPKIQVPVPVIQKPPPPIQATTTNLAPKQLPIEILTPVPVQNITKNPVVPNPVPKLPHSAPSARPQPFQDQNGQKTGNNNQIPPKSITSPKTTESHPPTTVGQHSNEEGSTEYIGLASLKLKFT